MSPGKSQNSEFKNELFIKSFFFKVMVLQNQGSENWKELWFSTLKCISS